MHKNNFNLIRLILSIMVVFSHSYGLLNIAEPIIFGRSYGNFAVHCFFALSGYLITRSYLNSKNIVDFFYKRALRLVPAYIVSYIFSALVAYRFANFVSNPVAYIRNGPVWTLSWEILCYGLCAIIGYFGLLNASSVGAVWIVSWILIISNISSPSPTFQVIVPMVFMFLIGSFISVNEEKFKISYSGPISIIILIIMVVDPERFTRLIDKLPWLYGPQFQVAQINFFIYLFLLPIAIMYLGKYLPFFLNLKDDLSYGVYIYAWPIQQSTIYLLQKNGIKPAPMSVFTISLVSTIILSYLSWRLIEKPINSLKRFDITQFFILMKRRIVK
jgi:peptidoglycan/LPS O-acetylase OafA/YrhL